ncbi:unnamed protein product [Lepeophtheirus salmonis]|uniref:(salmon louse) hypothetical protein n=1 Tax=Lepeophtheirus salmonis TaxID=72036 RepID=A0A7R8D4M0_LEPSM|nr:unnamed protein product [Lepeophtheirus salmonis]CAF2995912.1 unnamed protein product [Lepeophtheirus salmonis]
MPSPLRRINVSKEVFRRTRSKWISKKTQSCHKNYAEGFLNEDQLKYLAEKGKKSKIIWSSPTINKALKLKYACDDTELYTHFLHLFVFEMDLGSVTLKVKFQITSFIISPDSLYVVKLQLYETPLMHWCINL